MFHEEILNAIAQARVGCNLYPSYYGGHFIDDEGNLVINIVETYGNAYDSTVLSRVLSNANVSSQQVRFSYTNLHSVFDFIGVYRLENPDCEIIQRHVVWHYICVFNNRIVVGLYGYSEELKDAFKDYIINSPVITFQEGEPGILLVGEPIKVSDIDMDNIYHMVICEEAITILRPTVVRPWSKDIHSAR